MEVDEIQTQACKFTRINNARFNSSRLNHHPDDEDDGDHHNHHPNHHPNHHQRQQQQSQLKRTAAAAAATTTTTAIAAGGDDGGGEGGSNNRLRGWHQHSSRIIRVSRASGGKDRHSKVWTSKGLRDRRVRLSVTTAIQFYDLQDRLGCDQPSKAVEWLIKAAADAIAQLPSLNTSFPDTPRQLSDENKRPESEDHQQGTFDSAEIDGGDQSYHHHHHQNHQQQKQHQNRSLSKTSACSSNSETSKGSGLSLSRSEVRVNRVKARERARERAAKEKEKEKEGNNVSNHLTQSSFTELLTNGIGAVNDSNGNDASPPPADNCEASFFHRAIPMDYFNTGLLGPPTSASTASTRPHHHFLGQIQLGSSNNSLPQTMTIPSFVNPQEMQQHHNHHHFSFVNPDNLIPTAGGGGGDYNLNFTISSTGLAGFNRGTLQSNSTSSPSLLPHFQRFASSSSSNPMDGSNIPFFIGATPPPPPPVENQHHHQFPAGLQLYYSDGNRHSDHKSKTKN